MIYSYFFISMYTSLTNTVFIDEDKSSPINELSTAITLANNPSPLICVSAKVSTVSHYICSARLIHYPSLKVWSTFGHISKCEHATQLCILKNMYTKKFSVFTILDCLVEVFSCIEIWEGASTRTLSSGLKNTVYSRLEVAWTQD